MTFPEEVLDWIATSPDPEAAPALLGRWLDSCVDSSTVLEHLVESGALGRLLVHALSLSPWLADTLAQNPELAALATDPLILASPATPEQVVREGALLLQTASSPTHGLDRLRWLKQQRTLGLILADLGQIHPDAVIWQGISDLAIGLTRLARDWTWKQIVESRGADPHCPVGVVAFGKLGGGELNHSSDVDFVYVLRDDADEALERHGTRFCESLGRALSDRMGRGALYRVDLRLRPFGGTGPILARQRAIEAYYKNYAEPWEVLALIRSAWIAGDAEGGERWERMREETCFKASRSEMFFEEILHQRSRTEQGADPNDLKRGSGGIRDIEFLTQCRQMLRGYSDPAARVRSTLAAIEADPALDSQMGQDYTTLRRLEHRLQIVHDTQTHLLHTDLGRLLPIARSLGFASSEELIGEVSTIRARTQARYREWADGFLAEQAPLVRLAEVLGSEHASLRTWVARREDPDALASVLLTNQSSLERVSHGLHVAPAVMADIDAILVEQVVSGEIEEPMVLQFPAELDPRSAARLRRTSQAISLRHAFGIEANPGRVLTELYDEVLRRILGPDLIAIRLGSYATGDMGPASDADLILLISPGADPLEAEVGAQKLIRQLAEWQVGGSSLRVDFRLRPEGAAGRLTRTLEGFREYDLTAMEPWERMALTRSSLLAGDAEGLKVVRKAAIGVPYTPDFHASLMKMKHRIETERLLPSHVQRHVKLGWGGLLDIDWAVQSAVLAKAPQALLGAGADLESLLSVTIDAKILNIAERDELLAASRHHQALRWRISALGFEPDLIPENPDRLDTLSSVAGFGSGNEMLRHDQEIRRAVRTISEEVLSRLST